MSERGSEMRASEQETEVLDPRVTELLDAARQHLGHMSDRQNDAILRRIRSSIAERRQAPRFRTVAAVMGAGVCVALAALPLWTHHSRPDGLSFRVDGADVRSDGLVESAPLAHPMIRFSDGSEVSLSDGARVHVRAVDAHGASLTLDEGRAHAYVVHSPGTHWLFDAGPYRIEVKGTAFGLSWTASQTRLDVRLENGSVIVSGPVFDTPLALQAGQWLTVRARNVLIRDLIAETASSGDELWPSSAAPSSPDASPGEPGQRPDGNLLESSDESNIGRREPGVSVERASGARADARARSVGASSRRWTAALADGKFSEILDEAQEVGLDRAFASSSADDLAALADAARYLRRYDAAWGALVAERHRFPSSDHAHAAAFSLGRLAEAQRDPRSALSWFETYLSEVPDGIYASEALGRKMLLVDQLEGKERARPLAELYLRRFPTGTYVDPARALTRRP